MMDPNLAHATKPPRMAGWIIALCLIFMAGIGLIQMALGGWGLMVQLTSAQQVHGQLVKQLGEANGTIAWAIASELARYDLPSYLILLGLLICLACVRAWLSLQRIRNAWSNP